MSGSTISGLIKDIAKTNYKSIINTVIINNSNNYYIFKLGQVDIEYVFYYKKYNLKLEINILDFCNDIISKYIKLINNYKKINNNIIVCGSNMNNFENYINTLRQYINVSNLSVTKDELVYNILTFNILLKNACLTNNIIYFDLIEETTDCNTHYINDIFVGLDEHYIGAESLSEPLSDVYYGYDTHKLFIEKLLFTIKQNQI
jgi:hypothetical protein